MTPPPLADNENAPGLADWLATIPSIPTDWPKGIITLDIPEGEEG